MTEKKLDPRVRRTRLALQTALLELLEKKKFERIQIKELAAQADLSRHAFYSHFDTKEELLFSYVDDVFEAIIGEMNKSFELQEKVGIRQLFTKSFELWKEHESMLRYVMQVENKDWLIARLRLHAAAVLQIFIKTQGLTPKNHPQLDYIIDFLSGGGYMLIKRWMKEGMQYEPSEMAILIEQLIPINSLAEDWNGEL
ncbi:MAG: TetR/AcrR family transcriptional regulator [Chloroflexota bacterium]